MSLRNPKKYLYDIIDCCQFLLDFTEGKTVNDYKSVKRLLNWTVSVPKRRIRYPSTGILLVFAMSWSRGMPV